MSTDDSYRQWQEIQFQRLKDLEELYRQRTAEELVAFARGANLTVDDLLDMLHSGLSGDQLVDAIASRLPSMRTGQLNGKSLNHQIAK